uniref:Reverse transcriptase domain-containing protein n=1 Tax=Amphimedon queenslandica TaxID=400682 RepID=A0A1X7T952_AMPQE
MGVGTHHFARLQDAVAGLTRHLAYSLVEWNSVQALLVNRLTALDKCPGIRPIGVGETLRRIMDKTVCVLTRDDAESVCGVSQLCAGLQSGIEGAIATARDMFSDDDTGMLVMDAKNAFNSINRLSLLWNVCVLWPRTSRYIFNTYRGWSSLILKGCNETIYSREVVIQGDPLSMFVYAIGTIPLIQKLTNTSGPTQLWYADDSSALGNLSVLRS